MKALFLDVDGVLNTSKAVTIMSLSRPRMSRLRKIIHETGCVLVLSSTWRKHSDGLDKLKKAGLKFHGMTSHGWRKADGKWSIRGDEIQLFLEQHPEITRYAIVDDDSDMLDSQLRNFFQTTVEHGLTETHAHRIIHHLNQENQLNG